MNAPVCAPDVLPRAPWRTDPEVGHQAVLDADGLMVADCAIFGTDPRLTAERAVAVARLTSAGPTLLIAAKMLLLHIVFDPEGDQTRAEFDAMFATARRIVARAEGAQP